MIPKKNQALPSTGGALFIQLMKNFLSMYFSS